MSSPNGLDLSSLPADLQQLIAAEVAKAVAASQPQPPKELTPAEKAVLYLQQAEGGVRGEKPISAGSMFVHDRILAVLDILVDTVFPKADPSNADEPTVHEGAI